MRRPRLGHGEPDHHFQTVAPQCGRSDCARPASARLMLDITNRIVSIDLAIAEVGAGLLCFAHAEKIVVPRGWTLVDNRSVRPPLFDGDRYEVAPPAEPLPPVDVAVPLVAAKRRDRKRRNPLPPTAPDLRPAGSSTTGSPATGSSTTGSSTTGSTDAAQLDLDDRSGVEAATPTATNGPAADIEDHIEVVVDVSVQVATVGDADESADTNHYDLPSAYREASSVIEIDEPDRDASPLLARAFEVTRTKRR